MHKGKRVDLSFSDETYGTEEFGYIERDGRDSDDEDILYAQHVRRLTGDKQWRCVEGTLYWQDPARDPQFSSIANSMRFCVSSCGD